MFIIWCPVLHYQGTFGSLLSCPMPDEYLDYRNILGSAKKVLHSASPFLFLV
jgi:hypothetical protein